MKTVEQLSIDVLNYLYDTRPYDMQDAYDTREQAFENLLDTMSSDKGLLTEMMEEMDLLLKYEDLSDPILKKQYDDCCRICYDLNVFISNREKNKDMDI